MIMIVFLFFQTIRMCARFSQLFARFAQTRKLRSEAVCSVLSILLQDKFNVIMNLKCQQVLGFPALALLLLSLGRLQNDIDPMTNL